MSSLQCSALGLNCHFPRALLHGSLLLGRLGIPTSKQKTTKNRINFFLCNICRHSTISQKFDASIIFTQLEVGTFLQLFVIPLNDMDYSLLRHFVSKYGEKHQNMAFILDLHPILVRHLIPLQPTIFH
jgi:hypothetical protein